MTSDEFKIVFKEYYSPLTHFAADLLKDKQSAEDVVQEVFVRIWNQNEVMDMKKNIKSYLFTSVRNAALDHITKNKKVTLVSDTSDYEKNVGYEYSDDKNDEYILKDLISNSLRQLPPRCYDIFVLSKLKGYSQKEIAEKLGISIKTIENQMTKAYKILRELLKDKLPTKHLE